MKLNINENDYINIDSNLIEIKCGTYLLKFDSLQQMVDAFMPGIRRTCENNIRLSEMKFDNCEKSLFRAEVYDEAENVEYIIVARSYEEAELLFDNYLNKNYDDIEYVGVDDAESYCDDEDEYEELCKTYIDEEIGVYRRD